MDGDRSVDAILLSRITAASALGIEIAIASPAAVLNSTTYMPSSFEITLITK